MIIGKKSAATGYVIPGQPRLDPRGIMDIVVTRQPTKDGATLGKMTVDGTWIAYTLENPVREVTGEPVESWKIQNHTAIPRGRFAVVLAHSDHFGRIMPHLMDVNGFVGVLIHWGNWVKDTEGCILVGFTIESPTMIGASREAFSALFAQINDAINAGQKVWCTVA